VSDDKRAVDLTMDAPSLAESASRPVIQAAPGHPAVGQRFADRYDLDAELGRGGMGVVFRARDSLLGGEPVALKVLFADASQAPAIERFRREVRLARRITSPSIARTHDLGEVSGVFYLTMELVEGESLASHLERLTEQGKRLSPAQAVRIVRAIAEGLAAAHAADVVHRDLKPDNVLLGIPSSEGDVGRVVITDFGIARAFRGPEAVRATQGIAGTPAYMAPEQLEGKPTDARTDLYALGIVLYECLTGELPFDGDTPVAMALARLHQSARAINPLIGAPPALQELLNDLMARSPDARPADARALIARLDALGPLGGEGVELSVVPSSPRSGSQPTAGQPTPGQPTKGQPTTGGTRSSMRADVGLVVMPFEHRGPASEASVTSGVRDELIDVLSRTQGIRVVAKGTLDATPGSMTDVRTFHSRFGARFAVDAGVQVASGGERLRASIRLLEVATGVQVYSEVVDLLASDPFVAPERMAYKIAEALRLALEVSAYESKVSPELLDAYRQARATVRTGALHEPASVFEPLERVIAEAPNFAPPLALHALACVRMWFAPQAMDWHAQAKVSIERAMDRASSLAETRFAAAQVAWHEIRYREAVREARAALAIAPTYPDAMAFLGQLELEVGRSQQGLARLAYAADLEPALRIAVLEPVRWHGLYGDIADFDRMCVSIRQDRREHAVLGQYLVRVGAWRGDDAKVREGIQILSRLNHPVAVPLTNYGRTMLGEIEPVPLPDGFLATASPRLQTVALQLQAEVWAKLGREKEALELITKAADVALVDLEWIDRCRFFDSFRDTPAFVAARHRVLVRCEEIWQG
jgi:serine/threonine-protein kinase